MHKESVLKGKVVTLSLVKGAGCIPSPYIWLYGTHNSPIDQLDTLVDVEI